MKLKEIEMDWPYIMNEAFVQQVQRENGLVYEDAVRQDYEVNWREKRREFQLMTRCMTAMIERIMLPINTNKCWKILIECVDGCTDNTYKNLLGVYVIQVVFDFETFFTASDYEKKRIVIDTVVAGINRLSAQIPLDLTNILDACAKVKDSEYLNEWLWKKNLKIKDKSIRINIKHDVKAVEIYMIIMDGNNQILKKALLVSTVPDERVYGKYLGRLEIISENEVALITKDNERFIQMYN